MPPVMYSQPCGADALDDGLGAAVADGEAHPGPADEVEPAAGRAVEHGVAGDRLRRRVGGEVRLRGDRDRATGQALADVVVGLADEAQLHAGPGERAERLARGAAQLEPDRAVRARRARGRRSGRPRTSGPRSSAAGRAAVTEPWPRNAAAIADLERRRRRAADVAAGRGRIRAARRRRPPTGAAPMTGASSARAAGDRAQQPPALADDLADRRVPRPAASSRRRSSAMAVKKRTTSSGVPANLARRSSRWVAMPGRAGVEMALAGHVAADRDERRRPERELLGAEQRGDEQVAAGLQAAVGAQRDPVAQVVAQEDLVDLGEAELPRRPDVLDRRQRRRAGAAGVAGQVDVRGAGLGDAGRDRPDAAAGDELDADAGRRVDRAQVGDELGEVLDRVDVVVRRRADVALAGLAAAQRPRCRPSPCVPGSWPPSPGLEPWAILISSWSARAR